MRYKPLHCWDCGDRVIGGEQGRYEPMSNFRQVRFELADGSYCESPFCVQCAERPWGYTRMKAFEAAVNAVTPLHHIETVGVSGHRMLQSPILAVMGTAQAVQTNSKA